MAEPALTPRPLKPWLTPKILLCAAFQSTSRFGHDLINGFRAERFEIFLLGLLVQWAGVAVALPVVEYLWMYQSWPLLAIAGVGASQCVGLMIAVKLARSNQFESSISVVCIGTWVAAAALTVLWPPLLPVTALVALVPVAFAEHYISFGRGALFTVTATACVAAMAAASRFLPISNAVVHAPRWVETAIIVIAIPLNALNMMVIVWNNAAALRTSEAQLAEHAIELVASRTRLVSAADDERRRLERDLHDGAQQQLVALSVLISLARTSDHDDRDALLAEAADVVHDAITEIRHLAQGIFPPLLVSGGLERALPALADRAALPVHCFVSDVGRYPPHVEAALYYCCSEALQNAAKHGGPGTSAVLSVRCADDTLTMTVDDSGRGFQPTASGRGLMNMADRLAAVGGTVVVDTAVGRGTRVTASLTL